MMNIFAYYVKDKNKKQKLIIEKAKDKTIVYFCPKKQAGQIELPDNSYTFFYEDIEKTNKPYDLANENSILILDNCARYKNIQTRTFLRLSRLASGFENKLIVDIVPFTTGIEYLYVPWAYLSRTVLEHQHWYAFRENNPERLKNGDIVDGHDFKLLASKISKYCDIEYSQFFENEMHVVDCPMENEEKSGYLKVREGLFQKYNSYQPVITRLADYTNMVESRYSKLDEIISNFTGKTIIYTNIKSHNAPLKKRFKLPILTYYDNNGEERDADNIVLFEVPIVKSYLFLDVLANIPKHCKVWIFTSQDSTADKLLYKKMTDEFNAVNDFTKELWRCKNGQKTI